MPQFFLRAALYAAVLSIADAVEARRVHDRQRLQHGDVDQREDGGGRAYTEREGEHRSEREDGGLAHLAKRLGDVLPQGFHADPLRARYEPPLTEVPEDFDY